MYFVEMKKTRQKSSNLGKKEAMVATTVVYGRDHKSKQEENCAVKVQYGRDHGSLSPAFVV